MLDTTFLRNYLTDFDEIRTVDTLGSGLTRMLLFIIVIIIIIFHHHAGDTGGTASKYISVSMLPIGEPSKNTPIHVSFFFFFSAKGSYYLTTNGQEPFGKGMDGIYHKSKRNSIKK